MPGIYDEAYLDYVYQVVKKAGEYGLLLFIDPHQDTCGVASQAVTARQDGCSKRLGLISN
jgi:hypothetical protein